MSTSYKDLLKQREALEQQINEARRRELSDAVAQVRALLRWLAEVLEPAYGFASLFRFKGKFRPRYRPLSLAYRDPLQLPAIGAAVGRAYLPDASRREIVALARTAWEGRR